MKKRDIDLLFEVGALRFTDRTWKHFHLGDVANNTEHTFRVAWAALLIAKHEKAKDTARILKMALVHDLTEGRTGDANYLSRQYVERNDLMAGQDIFAQTILEGEMLGLLEEYRQRKTVEAQIVKDADLIDIEMELRELRARGLQLPQEWVAYQKGRHKTLYTKTALAIMKSIPGSDPHAWHTKSRNRFVGGDYSDPKYNNHS